MKQVIGTAVNMAILPCKGRKDGRTTVEVVVITAEPTYGIVDGRLVMKSEEETSRFACTPYDLRVLAADFLKWADEAEAWAASLGQQAVERAEAAEARVKELEAESARRPTVCPP